MNTTYFKYLLLPAALLSTVSFAQELDEEDADVYAYRIPQNQEFVEVSECVRELVILQEPQAPVKNPEEDFIFVSNNQADEGDPGAESPMDPRWEKLKALKSKMENRS